MNAIILAAFLSVPGQSPAFEPPPLPLSSVVLVTTDGHALEVKSYTVDGPMVRIIGLDGTPMIMRVSAVDLAKSEARTAKVGAAKAAKASADAQAQAEAEQAATDATAKRQAQDAATHERSKGRGSFSIASGSALKSGGEVAASSSAPASAPASSGGDCGATLSALRASYLGAVREVELLTRKHDLLVDAHNAIASYAEKRTIEVQIAGLRDQISTKRGEVAAIESKYPAAQEECRQSGAPPAAWNRQLGQ